MTQSYDIQSNPKQHYFPETSTEFSPTTESSIIHDIFIILLENKLINSQILNLRQNSLHYHIDISSMPRLNFIKVIANSLKNVVQKKNKNRF